MKKKKSIAKRIVHHYTVSLVDTDEHQEKFSFRINGLNTLLLIAFFTLFIVFFTFLCFRFTPIREYIQPEDSPEEVADYKKQLWTLQQQIYRFEDTLKFQQVYLDQVKKVVAGEIKAEEIDTTLLPIQQTSFDNEHLYPSAADSLLRLQIEKEQLASLKRQETTQESELFFLPVQGLITAPFDLKENHLAIDLAAPIGEPIKSIEKGVVVVSNWTPETGYVMVLQHPNEVLSLYKHCKEVFKQVGEVVKKGEVIASVGNTGEQTTGPHLHFELWVQGNAVDPEVYIDFK